MRHAVRTPIVALTAAVAVLFAVPASSGPAFAQAKQQPAPAKQAPAKEAAPAPRLLVPDLDARWNAAILRCLEKDATKRFASTADVITALTADGPPPEPPAEATESGGWARGFFRRASRKK